MSLVSRGIGSRSSCAGSILVPAGPGSVYSESILFPGRDSEVCFGRMSLIWDQTESSAHAIPGEHP